MLTDNIIGNYMSFGANLRRLRKDKGMIQKDLANESGIKLSHISKIEQDKTDPKLSTIYKLINALDCSADSLLMDSEKMGINGVLKASYDRARNLPDREKSIVVDVIDKYCTAHGLENMFANKSKDGMLFPEN